VFLATADSPGAGRDTISDFVRGQDRIRLSGIDAKSGVLLDQAFTFIGAAVFTNVAGQLNFRAGIISGDVNGDGVADFQINLIGATALAAADFYL
jgi:serralysin